MSIIESFFLKFTTNAKDAVADTQKVEQAIDQLDKKTSKNDEKAIKAGKEKEKQQKQSLKDSKEQIKVTQDLSKTIGTAFGSILAPLGLAIGAFGLLSKAVQITANAVERNGSLELTKLATGQDVRQVSAVNQAAKQFGGNGTEGDYLARVLLQLEADTGVRKTEYETLRGIREYVKNVSHGDRQLENRILQQQNPNMPESLRNLLLSDDFEKRLKEAEDLSKVNEGVTKQAQDFNQALAKLGTTIGGVGTTIETAVLPALLRLVDYIDQTDKGHNKRTEEYSQATGLKGAAIDALVLGRTTPKDLNSDAKLMEDKNFAKFSKQGNFTKQAVDYFMKQGYSQAEAAGITANLLQESGGNPNAQNITDKENSRGLAQWSKARRAEILAGTGIDIDHATTAEQLKAVAWELHQKGLDKQIMGMDNAFNSAALVSKKYERPAHKLQEAEARGLKAKAINDYITQSQKVIQQSNELSKTLPPANAPKSDGKPVSFKIDNINVHTMANNADDIAKQIAQHTEKHYKEMIYNSDDGVLA